MRDALDDYAQLCTQASGIVPDPGFNAWAGDIYLDQGVAINPRAAAHCIRDYHRTVTFLRAVHAAINSALARFPGTPLRILYAGCGPFATLLLPLLPAFKPAALEMYVLDVHQQSLDSVAQLISFFKLEDYRIEPVCADACTYQHTDTLHLVIAETMQKSLEQEPQFSVTANLAPQLSRWGIFVPEKIEVELCLAHLDRERELFEHGTEIDCHQLQRDGLRHPLATVLSLLPETAAMQCRQAICDAGSSQWALARTRIEIPDLEKLETFDAALFTRIQVFADFHLRDYEAEITLPLRCQELSPLRAGAVYQLSYLLGAYPKFDLLCQSTE